jgi:hypothetical protein
MEIVSINDRQSKKNKDELLEIVNFLKQAIDNGEITELVAASIDSNNEVQIHICAMDVPGAIGLFEIGKHLLITSEI